MGVYTLNIGILPVTWEKHKNQSKSITHLQRIRHLRGLRYQSKGYPIHLELEYLQKMTHSVFLNSRKKNNNQVNSQLQAA